MSTSSPPLQGTFETLPEVMDAAATQLGEREAYVEGALRLTFAQWIERADRLATTFWARGVRPGDVVALMLPPSIDYALGYAAAVRIGAVVTGLNTRLGPREVDAIVRKCRPALVIRDGQLPLADLPAGTATMDRAEIAGTAGQPRLDRAVLSPAAPTDPVVIIWTSGTTGVPKGAWFDHRGLAAAVTTAGVMAAPFDRRLSSTPFAHAGYMAKVWEQLAWGITLVLSPTPWRVEDMLRLLVDERIAVGAGVPTQWAKLLQQPGLDQADLSGLRLCLSATAPAAPELVEEMARRLGCPLIVRYAMTESPSIAGTEPGDPPEVQYRTVGRPQQGVELRVVDEAGGPVPAGEVGRIILRSSCAMRGYWEEPELTAAVMTPDGWLRTGDLGYLDADGNVVLVGRATDMYIRGGYNVYPLEVENVLAEHPGVSQAGVLGVPTPVIGEIGVAFVVPADRSRPPEESELIGWCRQRLTDYKAPDRVLIVDELPLTPMLKVDKAALRERLAGSADDKKVTAPDR